jgi:LysR family glycine cleavage system transcriptional activator
LNGLRAFEASACHLSFKRAADELCVTPGAVSQQVKSLEASIGVKLFRRLPRGLLLTAAGEDYLPSISCAFHAISDATENVAPALKGRRLRFAISPTLRREEHPAIGHLKRHQPLAKLVFTDDLSQLLDGKVDALLRASLQSRRACMSITSTCELSPVRICQPRSLPCQAEPNAESTERS